MLMSTMNANRMPPLLSQQNFLKGEIKESSRFIDRVPPNSGNWKWIPWKMGLTDCFKGIPPVAIFTII